MAASKSEGAFLTIGEVARELGLQQHILRYWETRFPQLRPLQRAGNRRYYRPEDVALARRIDRLLNRDGYTVRGVQQLLAGQDAPVEAPPAAEHSPSSPSPAPAAAAAYPIEALRALRDRLAAALSEDARIGI